MYFIEISVIGILLTLIFYRVVMDIRYYSIELSSDLYKQIIEFVKK